MTEHCYIAGRCFAYIGSKRQSSCQAIKELPLYIAFYSYTIIGIEGDSEGVILAQTTYWRIQKRLTGNRSCIYHSSWKKKKDEP